MIKKIIEQINNISLLKRYPIIIQFIKFCSVGLTNLVVDYLVYIFLTRFFYWHFVAAKVASFVVAVSWSFTINRRWTFKSDGDKLSQKYCKFFVANTIAMVLNIYLFYLAVKVLKIYDLLALLLVAIIVSVFNFILNRFWTFKDGK